MGDEASTSGKRRNGLSIFLGIVGAIVGFVGALALAPYNRMDPIASGMIALFVFGPMGAVAGAFLGAWLGNRGSGAEAVTAPATNAEAAADLPPAPSPRGEAIDARAVVRNSLKALAIVIGAVVVIGGGYALYAVSTATPWLKPAGIALQFEVRLPAGAAMPPASGVKAELQTSENTMPAEMKPNLFRRDGDRPVIVGQVDLAYRTANRQIEVKIAGQPDRTFYLTLLDKAPHSETLGAWQAKADGSEIRYRAKWPGRD